MAVKTPAQPARKQPPAEDPVYESLDGVKKDEKAHAKDLLRRIERAKSARSHFDTVLLPQLRRTTYGVRTSADSNREEPSASGDALSSARTNMVFATQATLLPHIYARNPEIAVTPTEAVGDEEYETIKNFSTTAQIMLNRCFVEEPKLKQRIKANIRSAIATSVGWLKLGWQESYRGDPITVRRINDIQDNLGRINALSVKLKDSTDIEEQKRLRQELENQKKAIEDSDEITVFKGFVIDRCSTEDVLILDETVREFDDYEHADELAMRVFMSDDEYISRYGRKPWKGSKDYPPAKVSGKESEEGFGGNQESQKPGDSTRYRCIWEVWSMKDGRIYTLCEGADAYVRAPYTPRHLPRRWHMLWCLGFNLVEGRWRPLSDVELLVHLQEEYNTTRYLYAEARKEAIPTRIYRLGGEIEDEDIDRLSKRTARGWHGVAGNPTRPIKDDIQELGGVTIDPAAYDVTLIRNDMDMMVGLSDASRSNLIQAKTATEATIMQQALANRASERQDTNEDMISDMAQAALQIMLQKFTVDEVKEIAGAGAVWPEPEQAGPEFWHKIRVQVRAGSTGKPNQAKEREDWGKIMPVLKEAMQQVSDLRAAGNTDMANAVIELAKETLRRFDERIDIDRFIPRDIGKDEEGPDAAQLQQELLMLKQQTAQLAQELQACQAELQQAQAQEQAKVAEIAAQQASAQQQAEADAQARAAEAAAKGEVERAKAEGDALVKAEAERARAAEAQAKQAIETAQINAKAETDRQALLTKAAVDLIAKLGTVQGTHGLTGPMGDLIDGASAVIQGVMNGTTQLQAGGRRAPAAEGTEEPQGSGTKRMKVRGPGGSEYAGEVTAQGGVKTITIKRPDGQVYTGTIEETP